MPSATAEECDALYSKSADPWNFRESAYEADKYAATLVLLPRRRYGRALEVGCSIGVLGRMLAQRCDTYLGIDASARAIALARREAAPNMEHMRMLVPDAFPSGPFDLILLSEILYFLSADDVARLAPRVAEESTEGDLMLVNHLGPTDRDLGGEEAALAFIEAYGREPDLSCSTEDFRIDVFGRRLAEITGEVDGT